MSAPRDLELLLAHSDWLARLARRLVADAAAADDLVQDTWVAALCRPPDAERPARPWLSSVIRRLAALRARRQGVCSGHRPDPGDPAPPADEALARVEQERALAGHVLALEEPYRSAVLLRYYRGMSAAQIARELGVPAATVRTHLKRGLERLRARLERTTDGGARAWTAALAPLCRHEMPVAGSLLVGGGLMLKLPVLAGLVAVVLVASWRLGRDPAQLESIEPESVAVVEAAHEGLAPTEPAAGGSLRDAPRRPGIGAGTASLSSARTLTVRVHFAPDRVPAAGVLVCTRPQSAGPLASSPWRPTGVDGIVRFDDPPPGRLWVMADRGAWADVEPVTSRCEVELEIPVGIDVTGEVVDEDGRPVGGAGIWLSTRGGDELGAIVARADAEGRFALRSVEGRRAVTSFAPDRGFGHGSLIEGAPGSKLEIRLVAAPESNGTIRGIVVTAGGEPLPEATVLIGHTMTASGNAFSDYEKRKTHPPPHVLRTDAAGEFLASGLSRERLHSVWVGAPGFAPWHRTVDVSPGAVVRIEMQRGAIVRGTVVDPEGSPAPRCEVRALQTGIDPAEGQAYQGPSWARAVTWTDDDGAYELGGLRAGASTLVATHRELGAARREIEVSVAQVVEWSPELDRLRELCGFLVDADGNPLVGWRVGTRMEPGRRLPAGTVTDEAGWFELKECEDALYDCLFSQEGSAMTSWALVVRGLSPGASPHRVVVPAERIASSYATGRVVDEHGAPFPELSLDFVSIEDDGTSQPAACDGAGDGTFHAGPLLPGRYTVWARRSYDSGRCKLGELTLRAGETADLGCHVFATPGFLEIHAFDDGGAPADLRTVVIEHRDAVLQAEEFVAVPGVGRSRPLQPGEYAVYAWSRDVAMTRATATVRSGETARVELRVPRGVVRTVQLPATPSLGCNLTTIWRDSAGEVRMVWDTGDHQTHRPRSIPMRFAPGTWEVEVATPAAPSAFATFLIEDREDPEEILVLPSPFDATTAK